MQGEDERREDNTAAGEEETTFTTNTEVSNNIFCNNIANLLVYDI